MRQHAHLRRKLGQFKTLELFPSELEWRCLQRLQYKVPCLLLPKLLEERDGELRVRQLDAGGGRPSGGGVSTALDMSVGRRLQLVVSVAHLNEAAWLQQVSNAKGVKLGCAKVASALLDRRRERITVHLHARGRAPGGARAPLCTKWRDDVARLGPP